MKSRLSTSAVGVLILATAALMLFAWGRGSTEPAQASNGTISAMSIDMDPFNFGEDTIAGACDAGNVADEDSDGFVNDGCPQVGDLSEAWLAGACDKGDVTNNDSWEDSEVNDGCPAVGNTDNLVDEREVCASINENDTLDADETAEDTVTFDVTAEGIPPYVDVDPAGYGEEDYGAMLSFVFRINYSEANLTIQAENAAIPGFSKIIENAGSAYAPASQVVPDIDGNNLWTATASDTGALPHVAEDGDGALHRIDISSDAGAVTGLYDLTLDPGYSGVLDATNNFLYPDDINNATVAVNMPCTNLNLVVDTDPAASPANTATSVGSVEACAVILNDDVLNADEDSVDSVEVDVAVLEPGIPTYGDSGTPDPTDDFGGMIAFGYSLSFNGAVVQVTATDLLLLIDSAAGSNPTVGNNGGTNPGQTFPNATGLSNPSVADQGPVPGSLDSGPGVLGRMTFEGTVPTADFSTLSLSNVGILDVGNRAHPIRSTTPGFIIVNAAGACTGDPDGDGAPGMFDNCPTVANSDQDDTDDDGIGDACDNCPSDSNTAQIDGDDDGPGDACDNCPATSNTAQTDGDNDDVGDVCDNCPATSNTAQTDGDNDDVGDVCDNCPATSNTAQTDGDNDDVGDVCDNCPALSNTDQANNDSDGQGDVCDVDDDNDGVRDSAEIACGSDPFNGLSSMPERVDGVFAGVSDDGDVDIDEPLPTGSEDYDCDGDGYTGTAENNVYGPSTQGDQDPCGTNVNPPTDPPSPIGWPSDLHPGTPPYEEVDSRNKSTAQDFISFLAPVRYLDTNVGTNTGDHRWDLVPGKGIFWFEINIQDLTALLAGMTGYPPMLGGERAFDGPDCPWDP